MIIFLPQRTAVITGLVNISNTYGAIRGTDVFYPQQGAGNTRYRRSFVATGFMGDAANLLI
ncbi:putative uracil/xanthine transporter [Shigella sonnei]|nr:putative uracil/xanthine transporter [Shigella sonnei]